MKITDVNGKEIKVGSKVRLLIDCSFYEYGATKDSIHEVYLLAEDGNNHFYTKNWSLPCLGTDVEVVEDQIKCNCDIMALMRAGCKCGVFKQEQERKQC